MTEERGFIMELLLKWERELEDLLHLEGAEEESNSMRLVGLLEKGWEVGELISLLTNNAPVSVSIDALEKCIVDFKVGGEILQWIHHHHWDERERVCKVISSIRYLYTESQVLRYVDWGEETYENERQQYEEKRNSLERLFMDKFGRAPKVLKEIYDVCSRLEPEKVLAAFSIPAMKKWLEFSKTARAAVKGIYLFGDPNPNEKEREKERLIISLTREIDDFAIKFAKKFEKSPVEVIEKAFQLPHHWKEKVIGLSMKKAVKMLDDWWASIEIQRFNEAFEEDFQDARCDLDKVIAVSEECSAQILEASDPLQIILGNLTNCCQTLDGAGSSCVKVGVMHPDAGFLAIKKSGRVVAQGFCWLANSESLVLDNIELSNDRDVSLIIPVLREWLEKVSYPNVDIGIGYNQMGIGFPATGEQEFPDFMSGVYTDARQRNWIKKNGVVLI